MTFLSLVRSNVFFYGQKNVDVFTAAALAPVLVTLSPVLLFHRPVSQTHAASCRSLLHGYSDVDRVWSYKWVSGSSETFCDVSRRRNLQQRHYKPRWRLKENNKRATMFKAENQSSWICISYMHLQHTHTHTRIHPITVVSHHFSLRLFPISPASLHQLFFSLHSSLVFPPALHLCKLSFSHHNSASVPSCCWLFAWNVICRCNRGRNWV